jgi:anionic cell wall polymer biosynthesis LytR-Cps2A-Psr (LCP) family protein
MKKVIIIIAIILILAGIGCFFAWQKVASFFALYGEANANKKQEQQIQAMIDELRKQSLTGAETDLFGEDGIVKILFIGLDNRIGETNGHCDAIQLIEINKIKQKVTITAVPRGTYSPLPGTGHKPTDYYVSKACEVGGLDYGVKQIEKILGQKADYLVFIGFSQAMGIFRQLDLPAEETMQWLRLRQGYAIGEPQRAKNHSTFIKQMMIKFTPQLNSKTNLTLGYLLFKLVRTDLTFNQGLKLAEEMVKIDLPNNPDRIQLLMRPAYDVKDISYAPEELNENMYKLLKPIVGIIPEGAYSGETLESSQKRLLDSIQNGLEDPEFIRWAFSNYVWLQIEDETERENEHFEILQKYVALLTDANEKNLVITDYIIEMEDLGKADWAQKGKEILKASTPTQ